MAAAGAHIRGFPVVGDHHFEPVWQRRVGHAAFAVVDVSSFDVSPVAAWRLFEGLPHPGSRDEELVEEDTGKGRRIAELLPDALRVDRFVEELLFLEVDY